MPTPANGMNISAAGLQNFDGTKVFTGVTTTQYNTLVGDTSNGIVNISPGTTGQALVSAGAAANPAYGTLPVAGGGTGATTLTGLVLGHGTSAMTGVTYTAQGSWSPTLRGASTAGTATYVFQQGLYTVIGTAGNGICFASFNVDGSLAGSAGVYQIGSFPFTASSSTNYNAQGVCWTSIAAPAGTISVSLALIGGTTTAQILSLGGNAYFSTANGANYNTIGTIAYFI